MADLKDAADTLHRYEQIVEKYVPAASNHPEFNAIVRGAALESIVLLGGNEAAFMDCERATRHMLPGMDFGIASAFDYASKLRSLAYLRRS